RLEPSVRSGPDEYSSLIPAVTMLIRENKSRANRKAAFAAAFPKNIDRTEDQATSAATLLRR
ncbi:hypothetical protein, partial [Rhodoblastus sp.]|uniref:hypothetical protein n=1 Tax=Rhodoblastus sp. TaxID=1962975 RepID=UPI003F989655